MAKRKNGDEISDANDHRAGADPADPDFEWKRIYGDLKTAIGPWAAFNWFGGCRFLSVDRGVVRLAHWGAFAAHECLRRHGRDLCLAAGAASAQVAYSGGFRPALLHTPARPEAHGTAHFSLPRASNESSPFRRNVVADAMRALQPPRQRQQTKQQRVFEREGMP